MFLMFMFMRMRLLEGMIDSMFDVIDFIYDFMHILIYTANNHINVVDFFTNTLL